MPASIPVSDVYWFRMARGFTQREAAVQAQISLVTYQRIETGRGNPSLPTLRQLAKVLKVSQARLRGED